MKSIHHSWLTSKARTALLLSVGMAAASASAANSDAQAAQQRFQEAQAACERGLTFQDRSTCMTEARAALQAARRGQLATPEADFNANRMARCDPLAGLDKVACVARMHGAGTVDGSVEGGGIYRELTLRYVVDPATGEPVAVQLPDFDPNVPLAVPRQR